MIRFSQDINANVNVNQTVGFAKTQGLTYLEEQTTIYSFRHSGAIEIFKRTGSIHKLQRAMGH